MSASSPKAGLRLTTIQHAAFQSDAFDWFRPIAEIGGISHADLEGEAYNDGNDDKWDGNVS